MSVEQQAKDLEPTPGAPPSGGWRSRVKTVVALILGTAFAADAFAAYPSSSQFDEVRAIAVEVEIDTNEAYYVGLDESRGSPSERRALESLEDLKIAAYEFSESLSHYSRRLSDTEPAFVFLDRAFLRLEGDITYLRAYQLYQSLFVAIRGNISSLRWFYLDRSYQTDYPYRVTVYFAPDYRYRYPYWRYPNQPHHHYHPQYYREPWIRHPDYQQPRRHHYQEPRTPDRRDAVGDRIRAIPRQQQAPRAPTYIEPRTREPRSAREQGRREVPHGRVQDRAPRSGEQRQTPRAEEQRQAPRAEARQERPRARAQREAPRGQARQETRGAGARHQRRLPDGGGAGSRWDLDESIRDGR